MPRALPRLVLALAAAAAAIPASFAAAQPTPPLPPAPAAATPAAAAPIGVALECQGWGRTKACPAFLLGFIEATPALRSSPRAGADVVLYVNVTEVANADHLHLRFVGEVEGAPPVVEVELDLDTRGDDDAQRAQLLPAFTRGVALFVAARHPDAVAITLEAPAPAAVAPPPTSPWGFEASLGGYGSYTRGYRSMNLWGSLGVSRVTRTRQLALDIGSSWGISRQPPLVIDGEEVSLDTDQYSVSATGLYERHLDPHWSVAATSSVWHEDPEGQMRLAWDGRVGVEWDLFPADDPRGNRLAVAYLAGYRAERYNVENELGERSAHYPVHGVAASGAVRKDKVSFGLYVAVRGELIHPERRYTISASPYVEWQLGDHVDVSFNVSATARALPAPVLDEASFEQVIRAAYAEPFSAYGSFNLRLHWDRTNGVRNDRFSDTR